MLINAVSTENSMCCFSEVAAGYTGTWRDEKEMSGLHVSERKKGLILKMIQSNKDLYLHWPA